MSMMLEEAMNVYHTSAAGLGMFAPEGWHPPNDKYGTGAVAPVLLRQKTFTALPVVGQAGGVESVPRLQA